MFPRILQIQHLVAYWLGLAPAVQDDMHHQLDSLDNSHPHNIAFDICLTKKAHNLSCPTVPADTNSASLPDVLCPSQTRK